MPKTIFDYKEFEDANRSIGQVCRTGEAWLMYLINRKFRAIDRFIRIEVKEVE